jgi:hypothetical protein
MQEKNDVPEFQCGVLPFYVYPSCKGTPPHPDMERDAFLEITGQFVNYMTEALKNPKDVRRPLQIMIAAERIMSEYLKFEFMSLAPELEALQEAIFTSMRVSRRHLIARALRSPPETWKRDIGSLDNGTVEVCEDFVAACKHLDEGKRLYEDLRARSSARLPGPPAA